MSGGHFDYQQFAMKNTADDVRKLIHDNATEDEWGFANFFTPDTIAKFERAVEAIDLAADMLHEIDWLVCGDTCEDSFAKRWPE